MNSIIFKFISDNSLFLSDIKYQEAVLCTSYIQSMVYQFVQLGLQDLTSLFESSDMVLV